jgi:hypothetical protein
MSRDVKYIGMDVHKAGLDVFAAGYPAHLPSVYASRPTSR